MRRLYVDHRQQAGDCFFVVGLLGTLATVIAMRVSANNLHRQAAGRDDVGDPGAASKERPRLPGRCQNHPTNSASSRTPSNAMQHHGRRAPPRTGSATWPAPRIRSTGLPNRRSLSERLVDLERRWPARRDALIGLQPSSISTISKGINRHLRSRWPATSSWFKSPSGFRENGRTGRLGFAPASGGDEFRGHSSGRSAMKRAAQAFRAAIAGGDFPRRSCCMTKQVVATCQYRSCRAPGAGRP